MRKFNGYLALLTVLGSLLLQASSASAAYKFGTNPFTTINQKANLYASTYGMTQNKLAAIMIAVSYNEAGSGPGSVSSPVPMALGRADVSGKYSYGSTGYPYGSYPRAWWHAGTGLWQFDSVAGSVYSQQSAAVSIPVSTAADVVAQRIGSRYSGATDFDKFLNSTSDWVACWGSDQLTNKCWLVYNGIYDSGSDTWRSSTYFDPTDSNVTNLGGTVWAKCWFNYNPSSQWDCLRVDPVWADNGDLTWRDGYGVNGNSSTTPLTYRFYVYQDGVYEDRFWKKIYSSYDTDVRAFRALGQRAKDSNSWLLTNEFCSNDFLACP